MDNQSLSHVRWKCQYHIVFISKYRKKVLYGKLRNDVREIIKIWCKYKDVQIIDGAVCGGSYTSKCGNSAKTEHIKFYGMFEREKHTDDL